VGHEINENTQALQYAFQQVILFCADGLGLQPDEIKQPDVKTMIAQNKIERQRLQQIMKFAASENDFWADYLGKFGIIEDAHYYAEYFQTMALHLGSIFDGDTILDAGCGNGFYGVSVAHSLMRDYQVGLGATKKVHYCGVDLTAHGLSRSYSRQNEELRRVAAELSMPLAPINYSYRKVDFDTLSDQPGSRLPFADGSISKLCCSLVISYLKDPSKLLNEFHRILSKGGVAVISSMKPGCDMTVLYHSYIDKDTPGVKRDQDANRLLSAAGKIKLKKDAGVYNFFSEAELERLVFEAGFTDISSCRSLGNQVNVIRVVK
jgi:ubiquinone/menaquinone biosynthesis C-methylase UbiE